MNKYANVIFLKEGLALHLLRSDTYFTSQFQDDLPLRTEVIFCMETLNLCISDVPLIEDVDINELSKYKENGNSKLQIVLVDHNKIFDLSLEPKHLVEIIDHHRNYKESFGEHVKLTSEMVGSCATLVMNRIWNQDSSFEVYSQLHNPI